jgi:hypothetical protein
MTQPPDPFYLNWTFWAVIISFIALVLSQLPPLHIFLKKAKLDFELFSSVCLTHKVGNPNLESHIIINNVGGRNVRVKGIKIDVSSVWGQALVIKLLSFCVHISRFFPKTASPFQT